MAKFFLTLLCILYALYLANAGVVTFFRNCTSEQNEGKIEQLEITAPCNEKQCLLEKGTMVEVKVTFIPAENITEATSVVHGIIAGIPLPLPLTNPDACDDSGLKCPLTAGQKYVYITHLPVSPIYASVDAVLKWEMQDQARNNVFCFEIPIKFD